MSRFCRGMLWAILIFAGLALMWASIVYGQAEIPAKEVFYSLFDRDQENSNFTVIYSLRLPRLGLALLAGSAFAVSGAILQGVLHNDLAEPGLIGVSSGGGLAGLAVMLYLPGYPALQLPAAAAAALGTALLLQLLSGDRPGGDLRLILLGAALSAFLGACCSILLYFNPDKAISVLGFTSGSLSYKSWDELLLLLPYFTVGMIMAVWGGRSLNLLSLGEEMASSLGLAVAGRRRVLLVTASILGACGVGAAGLLGFVGLLAPHGARLLLRSGDYRKIIWLSAILGAELAAACDLIARTAVPGMELPTGMITMLAGPVFFIYLLIDHQRRGYAGA